MKKWILLWLIEKWQNKIGDKERFITGLIEGWLPGYHLSKNPPKGTTKARKVMPLFKAQGGENE